MTPKSFRARFIEPGLISYADQEAGTVLVSREALDRMAPSFKGCPVIFVPEHHNDSDKDTAFNFDDIGANPPSGIVSDVPTWGDDGWQSVNLLVWDENAIKAIEKGFSVSCAYLVDETGEGGEWHQLPYDEEITNGHYMHMAIVPRPRYEGSQIMANSKGGHKVALFKKQNAAPPVPPKATKPEAKPAEPVEEKGEMMNADTEVDVNGTPVPLHELIEAYMESQGAGTPAALGDEDMVQLPDGTKVTVADLKAAYTPAVEPDGSMDGEPAPNAEPPADTAAMEPISITRQKSNAAPEPKLPTKKVNQSIKNAAREGDKSFDPRGEFDSEATRLERGKARYSRSVPQGGK